MHTTMVRASAFECDVGLMSAHQAEEMRTKTASAAKNAGTIAT